MAIKSFKSFSLSMMSIPEKPLFRLGPGQIFGEERFLTTDRVSQGCPYSVRCATQTAQVWSISYAEFSQSLAMARIGMPNLIENSQLKMNYSDQARLSNPRSSGEMTNCKTTATSKSPPTPGLYKNYSSPPRSPQRSPPKSPCSPKMLSKLKSQNT